MTQEEMIKEYQEKICPYCKGQCEKGINIVKDYKNKTISAKCEDYEKDKTKINGYIKPLKRTAKIEKCVMQGLITDWSNL